MTTKKVLQPTNDVYIQFTEEELISIGAGPGTKFETKLHDDGSIELRPYVGIELDIADWPREVLEMIIKDSCEQDISANDVINNLLKESLDKYPTDKDLKQAKEELLLERAAIDPDVINKDTSICGNNEIEKDILYKAPENPNWYNIKDSSNRSKEWNSDYLNEIDN
jgi:hypothetical protein